MDGNNAEDDIILDLGILAMVRVMSALVSATSRCLKYHHWEAQL